MGAKNKDRKRIFKWIWRGNAAIMIAVTYTKQKYSYRETESENHICNDKEWNSKFRLKMWSKKKNI